KIVLRILDIMVIVLNIWFFILQKVIMLLGFILNIILQLMLYSIYDDENIPFSLFVSRKKT
uniref:hypothetical protein n=1 Tax=Vaccinium witches'-broom phytoplasma TaxID=85642 RepID=UPI000570ECC2